MHFFLGPNPGQTRTLTPTPSSLRGVLELHTSSPFSHSTLQVDGLIFPPPPRSHHHHLPAGVFPPSPQPGTPPIPTVNTDVYKNAYSCPLAKQLSPIVEQDYFSPISARGFRIVLLVLVRELIVYSVSGSGMGVGTKG